MMVGDDEDLGCPGRPRWTIVDSQWLFVDGHDRRGECAPIAWYTGE